MSQIQSQIFTVLAPLSELPSKLANLPFTPMFLSGYASSHIDFYKVASVIKSAAPNAKFLICSTSGELCGTEKKLYCDTPDKWDNVVLQLIGPDIIQAAEIVSIGLECDDLKQGRIGLDMNQRVGRIRNNIMNAKMSLPIDFRAFLLAALPAGSSTSRTPGYMTVSGCCKAMCLLPFLSLHRIFGLVFSKARILKIADLCFVFRAARLNFAMLIRSLTPRGAGSLLLMLCASFFLVQRLRWMGRWEITPLPFARRVKFLCAPLRSLILKRAGHIFIVTCRR